MVDRVLQQPLHYCDSGIKGWAIHMKKTADPDNNKNPEFKKPSLVSQAIPYLFTAAILIWVFAGLSSNVLDERHTLSGTQWYELGGSGVRHDSIEIRNLEGTELYCGHQEKDPKGSEVCPSGSDYVFAKHPEQDVIRIRRMEVSRIPNGGPVSVNYVKKVKLSEIWAMVKGANLNLFIPVMILYSFLFFFADVFSFGYAYRWFNAPDLKMREIMEVRGAPYIIQIGLAPLAEVFFPLYMWRVKKVPATRTMSVNLWGFVMDFAAIFTAITPAVIYNLYVENLVPAIGKGWLIACLVFWALFFGHILFWRTRFGKRMVSRLDRKSAEKQEKSGIKASIGGGGQLMAAFGMARWHHIVRCYLVRAGLQLFTLLSNYVTLLALGMTPSLPMALIAIPIIMVSIFQPIGVGGYGGPQLIAWFLFVKLGGEGSADQVIAYSLLWSTAFLIGRAVIGLIFIRGFWKQCFSRRV